MISSPIEQNLVRAAEEGVKNARTRNNAPDDFRIGAAVLAEKGQIYSSGQYFSDTYSLTLHAEQAALAHAAAHGDHTVIAIAVTWNDGVFSGNTNESIYPCHMCKQLLCENSLRSGKDIEILIVKKEKIIEKLFLKEIMRYTWPK
jgi:cytidine deaminase